MLTLILTHSQDMGTRRQARERAVQFLFQFDMNPEEDLESALDHFWLHQRPEVIELLEGKSSWGEQKELPPPTTGDLTVQQFAEPLVRGVIGNRDSIDRELISLATNWDLNRMALEEAGVLSSQVDILSRCTSCSPDFFSYRRDRGSTGRQCGIIARS